ncbi:MAG TPA: helix-turn-helix domain-containing protein, partial [Acidimicrobiales bacterium]|nr:helix-turn-helix domain-containing protein [Acidimicrobiales bacterium]
MPVEEQRRQVLEAALAVFGRHGYRGATIEAVARQAGTPRPTVYELFGGKDPLFVEVVRMAAGRVVACLTDSTAGSRELTLRSFVRRSFA